MPLFSSKKDRGYPSTPPITIVSGLPRSGTSLMMQMLKAGGMPVVTDHIRKADTDNPQGYFEYERAKQIKKDASWLPQCRSKAFKMVSMLLYDLPPTETYRIIFMQRQLDEMVASQNKMLVRQGTAKEPTDDVRMVELFRKHLSEMENWLASQPHMDPLFISYNQLMADPKAEIRRLVAWFDRPLDAAGMSKVVDPSLYRNRKNTGF